MSINIVEANISLRFILLAMLSNMVKSILWNDLSIKKNPESSFINLFPGFFLVKKLLVQDLSAALYG